MASDRLTPADLDAIRARHAAAPHGPWISKRWVGHCWTLHAGAQEDRHGKMHALPGQSVVFVLATPEGREFCLWAHIDVARLLLHIDELERERVRFRGIGE